MREIKLRYTFKRLSDGQIYQAIMSIERIEEAHPISSIPLDSGVWELIARDLFTGIADKNGADIYDQDILLVNGYVRRLVSLEPVWQSQVGMGEAFFDVGIHIASGYGQNKLGEPQNKALEVIGNIHEHPHLIREEELCK
jgi:hypothetical protein